MLLNDETHSTVRFIHTGDQFNRIFFFFFFFFFFVVVVVVVFIVCVRYGKS